jgi:hypothetical protein
MACRTSAACLADAPGQEQVVEHQQVGLDPGLSRSACSWVLPGIAGELGVGLEVAHIVALQRGLVGHGLGHVALAGAGLADDQRVGALGDELERVQLEAGLALGSLGLKRQSKSASVVVRPAASA